MSAAAETLAITSDTQEFLAREHKLFIDGRWQTALTGETYAVIDPATEAQISTIQVAGEADVDVAVAVQVEVCQALRDVGRIRPRFHGRRLRR